MSDSKRNSLESKALNEFNLSYSSAATKEEKDTIWGSINTPFIEEILDDSSHRLVTFLYRQEPSESKDQLSIYLHCDAVGLPFAEKNRLQPIPETDICYLSLILPSTLRTTYSFLRVENLSNGETKTDEIHHLYPFPEFSGELKKIHTQIMKLHEENKVEVDTRNPTKISYMDYDDPSKCFATESILELPMAPKQSKDFSDIKLIKQKREKLKEEKRFFECLVKFSETSLKNIPEYKDIAEDKERPARGVRKYWIYLPPGYKENSKQPYPLTLLLDGSDYLNTIPVPSILENMIKAKNISPCIAVFFEYSANRRQLEYYGDDKFTNFLANDLMRILRSKHHLSISDNPRLITIVGLSASGLAAVYAGLTRPDVFGNVITQSAALWSKKKNDLEKIVDEYLLKKADTYFCMDAGLYETVAAECCFSDGYIQAISILQANKDLVKYMNTKGLHASFHEFVGGHNYVCYRDVISDQLKEVYEFRYSNKINANDIKQNLRSKL